MSEKTYTSNLANGDPLDNNKQLVITRADMVANFSDDEFQACTDAMSDGFSVVIHFSSGSGLAEATLARIGGDGTLTFTTNTGAGQLLAYKVAPGATHSITASAFDVDDSVTPTYNTGTKIADIKLNGVSSELHIPSPFYYVDTDTDTRDTIQDAFNNGFLPIIMKKNPAGYRQVFYFTQGLPSSGYSFAYTDSSGTHGWAIDVYDNWSTF